MEAEAVVAATDYLLAAAAAIEALRPGLPRPLTPDAAYHLVQLLALVFFYRGGLLFPDRKPATQSE